MRATTAVTVLAFASGATALQVGMPAPAGAMRAGAAPRMATLVTFGDESRACLLAGIDAVANAVKVTIGPKGRNVVLERSFGVPEVVNDGVTIARDIELEDPRHNVGAKLIVEVASKSDQKAGDGTTTSCVLTQALVREGLKLVASGANPIALQRGLQKVRLNSLESAKPNRVHDCQHNIGAHHQPDCALARATESAARRGPFQIR